MNNNLYKTQVVKLFAALDNTERELLEYKLWKSEISIYSPSDTYTVWKSQTLVKDFAIIGEILAPTLGDFTLAYYYRISWEHVAGLQELSTNRLEHKILMPTKENYIIILEWAKARIKAHKGMLKWWGKDFEGDSKDAAHLVVKILSQFVKILNKIKF